MDILPSKELVNIPNILLILFSAILAVFVIHLAHKPFEQE